MPLMCSDLPVERLNGGQPILAPRDNWWEDGVTFNAAALHLAPSPENLPLIERLLESRRCPREKWSRGVVVLHYRARPLRDSHRIARSHIGMAIFTPELELLWRPPEPIIRPDENPQGFDHLGVEDPRITRIGDQFVMLYCGVGNSSGRDLIARICCCVSQDLIHWEKLGPVLGDVNRHNNKDGVLLPEPIDGQWMMLHRPMLEAPDVHLSESDPPMIPNGLGFIRDIHLAVSDSPTGVWCDCGRVMSAFENPAVVTSWIGAGSVPIPLGDRRYLALYHVGNLLQDGQREYDLDAAILNFQGFSPAHPDRIVESRLEHLMVPETKWEIEATHPDSLGNVLFTCGSYEDAGHVHIIYGGGDTMTMAARVSRAALVERLERCGLSNPFLSDEVKDAEVSRTR